MCQMDQKQKEMLAAVSPLAALGGNASIMSPLLMLLMGGRGGKKPTAPPQGQPGQPPTASPQANGGPANATTGFF